MAIMPLNSPAEWGWDSTTQELVCRFRERQPTPDDPPPTREAIVRLKVSSINVRDIILPEAPPPPPPDE